MLTRMRNTSNLSACSLVVEDIFGETLRRVTATSETQMSLLSAIWDNRNLVRCSTEAIGALALKFQCAVIEKSVVGDARPQRRHCRGRTNTPMTEDDISKSQHAGVCAYCMIHLTC